jgi:hypothetical protein
VSLLDSTGSAIPNKIAQNESHERGSGGPCIREVCSLSVPMVPSVSNALHHGDGAQLAQRLIDIYGS